MRVIKRTICVGCVCVFAVTEAAASAITELGVASYTLATAEAIPGAVLTLPVPATVFNPPGYATATINSVGGGSDVDFSSFFANGGEVYFDIDNLPFTFDTILSLFNSAGTFGDSSLVPTGGTNPTDSGDDVHVSVLNPTDQTVPEPESLMLVLLGIGLSALAFRLRKRT
jgi:PEP-CTERM motif